MGVSFFANSTGQRNTFPEKSENCSHHNHVTIPLPDGEVREVK